MPLPRKLQGQANPTLASDLLRNGLWGGALDPPSQTSCKRDANDPDGPGFPESLRAGGERGACGQDVVDQQDAAGNLSPRVDARRVADALGATPAYLTPAATTSKAGVERERGAPSQCRRDLSCRVEAAEG